MFEFLLTPEAWLCLGAIGGSYSIGWLTGHASGQLKGIRTTMAAFCAPRPAPSDLDKVVSFERRPLRTEIVRQPAPDAWRNR